MSSKKAKKDDTLLKTVFIGAPILSAAILLGVYLSNNKLNPKTLEKKSIEELKEINNKLINDLHKCKMFIKNVETKGKDELDVLQYVLLNKSFRQKGGFPFFNDKKSLIKTILRHSEELENCKKEVKVIENKYKEAKKTFQRTLRYYDKR